MNSVRLWVRLFHKKSEDSTSIYVVRVSVSLWRKNRHLLWRPIRLAQEWEKSFSMRAVLLRDKPT